MKEQILRFMKSYGFKPFYILRVQAEACQYTILLNGIPVTGFATRGGTSNELPLNNYILKSGRQTLTVEILPYFKNRVLDKNANFSAEVGLSMDAGAQASASYTRLAQAALGPQQKEKSLPAFITETAFEAKVPWDYSGMLTNAQKLPPSPTVDALLHGAVTKMHRAIQQKSAQQYQSLIIDAVAKESDVLFRTPAEIDDIVAHSGLSDVKQVAPLPSYKARLFADGKIVQAVADTADEYGARGVVSFSIHPLTASGQDGVGTEDHLYYLPRGASELSIF